MRSFAFLTVAAVLLAGPTLGSTPPESESARPSCLRALPSRFELIDEVDSTIFYLDRANRLVVGVRCHERAASPEELQRLLASYVMTGPLRRGTFHFDLSTPEVLTRTYLVFDRATSGYLQVSLVANAKDRPTMAGTQELLAELTSGR
jgi:hypothetical protein